jgi:hypothetical protein
VLFKHFK